RLLHQIDEAGLALQGGQQRHRFTASGWGGRQSRLGRLRFGCAVDFWQRFALQQSLHLLGLFAVEKGRNEGSEGHHYSTHLMALKRLTAKYIGLQFVSRSDWNDCAINCV